MPKTSSTLIYLAICSKKHAPGVARKIEGFVAAANKSGYAAKTKLIVPGGLDKYFTFIKEVIAAREDVVVIRYINRVGLLIFFAGMALRLRNKAFIVDVPTPMQNHLKEITGKKDKQFIDLIDKLLVVFQGALPFQSATRIIQYAEESIWFSAGVKHKTIKIGNGIDVATIPCRRGSPPWPTQTLNLLAVGTVAFWHGWDKVIRAIHLLKEQPDLGYEIKFTIVGEGPELVNLKRLTESLGLSANVKFTGMLYDQDLFKEYEAAHFGIGSLGWHRLNIKEASPLKIREYLAAGLPVISATHDPDFIQDTPVLAYVSSEENNDDLLNLLKKIKGVEIPSISMCRQYAEDNLDYLVKVRSILPAPRTEC